MSNINAKDSPQRLSVQADTNRVPLNQSASKLSQQEILKAVRGRQLSKGPPPGIDQSRDGSINDTKRSLNNVSINLNQSIASQNSSFTANKDGLLMKLKEQEKLKELNQEDMKKYLIEADDDGGQIQQVSGGFGDSTNLDEETLKALVVQQQEAEKRAQANIAEQAKWNIDNLNEDYIMESNMFDYEEIKKSPMFGIKKYADAIYRGELVNGKRDGFGTMVYRKNRIYEGQWVDDYRQGKGMEKYSNGNKYEGDFKRGKADGRGVYNWANGEVYDGEWQNGVKEGHGMWRGIFGDSYLGTWKNSKADGNGVHQWKNGDRYEGSWVNCLKHGKGTDIFAMGDIYTGQYAFGKPDGYGSYKWKNGSSYVGEFKEGHKHGKGEWKKKKQGNCNRFEGMYMFDKKNGQGTFTWESGNIYVGNYVDDERQGYGEMYWTDGSHYKGEWKKGIQHGKGIMNFPDGRIKDGYFENNIFKGKTQIKEGSQADEFIKKNSQNMRSSLNDSPHKVQLKDNLNSSHGSIVREQKDLKIKTRGGSRSQRRQKIINNAENSNANLSPLVLKNALKSQDVNIKTKQSSVNRPHILKPIHPPSKREGSQLSSSDFVETGYVSQSGPSSINLIQRGYASQGRGNSPGPSDSESARMSNVNTHKFNRLTLSNSNANMTSQIQKVSPAAQIYSQESDTRMKNTLDQTGPYDQNNKLPDLTNQSRASNRSKLNDTKNKSSLVSTEVGSGIIDMKKTNRQQQLQKGEQWLPSKKLNLKQKVSSVKRINIH